MKRVAKILFVALCMALASVPCMEAAPPKVWEVVKVDRPGSRLVVKDSDVEVRSQPGAILVIASKPVEIKVFTILGQLVSHEHLPAASFRLPISNHGIYIVKAGELTGKVAQ